MPSFAKVAGPLHSLTHQEIPFHWTSECQLSFDRLKELLSPPVLAYPNFDLPFTLHTDASGKGLGAVLEQEASDGQLHPVAYASRTLSKHERNYGVTELEALGVIWALRHFRAFLLGHSCVVVTDHAPLRALLKARHQSGKLDGVRPSPSSIWRSSIVLEGHMAMPMHCPGHQWNLLGR